MSTPTWDEAGAWDQALAYDEPASAYQVNALLPDFDLFPVPNGDFSNGTAGGWGTEANCTLVVTNGIARFDKATSTNPYLYHAGFIVGLPTGMILHGRARVRGTGNISGILIDDGWNNSVNGTPVTINSGSTWTTVDFWWPASEGNSGAATKCRWPVIWSDSVNTWIEIDWVKVGVDPGGALQFLTNPSFDTAITGWAGDGAGSTFSWQSGGYARIVPGTSADPYFSQITTGGIASGWMCAGRAQVRGKGSIGCHLRDLAGNTLWGTYVPFDVGAVTTVIEFPSPTATSAYTRPWVVVSVDKAAGSYVEADWITVVPGATQGWPTPQPGDMLCDPSTGRVSLFEDGIWQELSAVAAYKLVTARTLTLSGDVTGSVSTNLSAGLSIATAATDRTHVHNLAFVFGWRTTAFTGGAGTTYISWEGSTVGGGATSPGHSGTSIRLGKAGWWLVGMNVMQSDTTGAGIRSTEVAVGVDLQGIERVNSDASGRYAANPQGVIYSNGSTTFNPHVYWTTATTLNAAFFWGVWLRA